MTNARSSASLVALALATMIVAATPAGAAALSLKSVGEIFVDAQGLASGQNVAGRIGEAEGAIASFHSLALGTTVFDAVRIDGFALAEQVGGEGSSLLLLRGANARVLLHDNLHSILEIEAEQATTVTYRLAAGVSAAQEGASGGVVRLMHAGETLGHLVAVGSEGARTRGETVELGDADVRARLQSGSEMLFVARSAAAPDAAYHDALVDALAQGALASQYITEFEGSSVATSQVDTGEDALARTRADGRGFVETALAARPRGPTLLVYELAYETLPARSADEVAVYVDGERAQRVTSPGDVLARVKDGLPLYHASSAGGRTQVLAATADAGDHRVVVSVGAQATTERQGRAESGGADDARVYGGFEHHANGKLTGEFLTGVLPDDRAILLGLTSLATRTELFRNLSIDGGAAATFRAHGEAEMRITTAKADLTLVDDAHATMKIHARAPVEARFELASGVLARAAGDSVLALEGPHGPAGALALVGEGGALATDASGAIRARLAAGGTLVYRAAPDAHASEDALLRALADGRLGAQALAGVHAGALVGRATSYSDDVEARVEPIGSGALEVAYLARGEAARAFALDLRGAALAATSATDVRVLVDGVAVAPSAHAHEALELAAAPRWHATASAEGALRILVNTASVSGERVVVRVESVVEESARERVGSDAFGSFRLFSDGSAIGSFVTLKADAHAGALSGLSNVASGDALFASLVAGSSPYVAMRGDGTSLLTFQNEEARIEVSDSTNAFTKIVATAPADAAFRLAAGLRAQARTDGVVDVVASDGRHVGSLVASRAAMLAVRGEGEVRASLAAGGEILFRTHDGIESELSAAQRSMINAAIAAGRVAGQVTVQAAGAATTTASATYGDVEMAVAATRERVEVTIDSATEHGKTLIVSLDPDTIPGMARGKAAIRFDGALVAQAASYADILDPSDDDGAAEYFVLAGDAGTQVLVSIPHFSVHTVTLEQQTRASDTWLVVATIFLGLVVSVQSVLLARKSRANKQLNTQRRP